MNYNIAVGGFHHETNTFSPAHTPYEEFLKADGWPGLLSGKDLLTVLPALNLPLGGFLNAAQGNNIFPTTWANAEPYGPVTRDAFEKISNAILDQLPDPATLDAVYLDMHGAMVAEHVEDGEGELLSLIRNRIGSELPLVISLDFHANLTPRMFEHADVITIFRTYPHLDMAQTGQRVFDLLLQMLSSGKKLAKAYRQVPYLIPLSSQHTGSVPCSKWLQKIEEPQDDGIDSVDIAYGFPPADIFNCGPAVVTYGNCDTKVSEIAERYLKLMIESESEFEDLVLPGDDAVKLAIEKGRPGQTIVIADVQDNPGAGGSADTTGVLEALIAQKAQHAVIGSLFDPVAAASAHQAGCGSTISIELGGHNGPAGVIPFQGEFIVETLSDGAFICEGAMLGGVELQLGPMALLKVANSDADVRIAVTSERFQCLDQGLFRELGVEPSEQAIVVVKSTVHFRADFEPIASEILMAEFPGNHPCSLKAVNYKNLRPGLRLVPHS